MSYKNNHHGDADFDEEYDENDFIVGSDGDTAVVDNDEKEEKLKLIKAELETLKARVMENERRKQDAKAEKVSLDGQKAAEADRVRSDELTAELSRLRAELAQGASAPRYNGDGMSLNILSEVRRVNDRLDYLEREGRKTEYPLEASRFNEITERKLNLIDDKIDRMQKLNDRLDDLEKIIKQSGLDSADKKTVSLNATEKKQLKTMQEGIAAVKKDVAFKTGAVAKNTAETTKAESAKLAKTIKELSDDLAKVAEEQANLGKKLDEILKYLVGGVAIAAITSAPKKKSTTPRKAPVRKPKAEVSIEKQESAPQTNTVEPNDATVEQTDSQPKPEKPATVETDALKEEAADWETQSDEPISLGDAVAVSDVCALPDEVPRIRLSDADLIAKQVSLKATVERLGQGDGLSPYSREKLVEYIRSSSVADAPLEANMDSIKLHANQLVIDKLLRRSTDE